MPNIKLNVQNATKRDLINALIQQINETVSSKFFLNPENKDFASQYLYSLAPRRNNYVLWSDVPEKKKYNFNGKKYDFISYIVKNEVSRIKYNKHYINTFNPTYSVRWYLTNITLTGFKNKQDINVSVLHIPVKIKASVEFALNKLLENLNNTKIKTLLEYAPQLLLDLFSDASLDEKLFADEKDKYNLMVGVEKKLLPVANNGVQEKYKAGDKEVENNHRQIGELKFTWEKLPRGSVRSKNANNLVLSFKDEILLDFDASKLSQVPNSVEEWKAYNQELQSALTTLITAKMSHKTISAKSQEKFAKLINKYLFMNFNAKYSLDGSIEKQAKALTLLQNDIDKGYLTKSADEIEKLKQARLLKMQSENLDTTNKEFTKSTYSNFSSADDIKNAEALFDVLVKDEVKKPVEFREVKEEVQQNFILDDEDDEFEL